ncbi:OB-fold nucleic acid binding domain-containing protein, partial [Rhizobium rhizogenes]|uniref:OB-fold nucleic acid binding domain-containing protein n=3 Tax=Rhizobium/Agrobacterium group TaxID=227290 RepID=UPI001F30EB2E
RQMTDGHNVIEDYSHTGLTLRQHPIAFLRKDLSLRNIITCAEAMNSRDGRWVYTAGLVLVRQMPGSAKGVMFITIEDETGPANLVVWPTLFEKRRRIVLGSSMMAINGRIQREGEVVHLVAQQLFDLSGDLTGLADRDEEFKLPAGRGDEFAHGSPGSSDTRDKSKPVVAPRDIFAPDLHIDTLKIKSRNFH